MLCNKEFKNVLNKVVVKYSDVLDALDNFESSGRISRIAAKKRFNFTLDNDLMKSFRVHCHKNNLKMSSEIEGLIKEKVNQ
ncbi:hypothetical protein HN592_06105 [Candidatus Woesearchaeota archaeon]|jgi:hypothetical protein|nr:hypothetical protein [Candidatus Woesearchaeota archaeon]MBT4367837.1 hypothetical protein [Candidatus Woesearchaeota archaeon]MBT4712325.1 hypothetical protein [Candidatus Woesearchaeota archaeon]MBT6639237.1 hypothetical protein [Candidatus Woesearchaeota archaeon]MBT7133410.1 hypothetical protein [Candidatus Woesearchaeota archaeon]